MTEQTNVEVKAVWETPAMDVVALETAETSNNSNSDNTNQS